MPGYGRPAGHLGRPPNRGDLEVPAWTGPEAQQLYPGWRCDGTFDVSGGWYDAGDYGKYVTSGAIAVWRLLGTLDLLKEADRAPIGELADMIRAEVSLAARLVAADAGPTSDPLAGLAFHRVRRSGHRCRAGRTRTRPRYCIVHRRRRACTWPRWPRRRSAVPRR